MADATRSSSGQKWVAITALATVVLALLAFLQWGWPRNAASAGSPETVVTVTATPPDVVSVESSEPQATQVAEPATRASDAVPALYPLALADLDSDNFIEHPYRVSGSAATIAGTEYPASYSWQFYNCGGCTAITEFKVPAGYATLSGVVGLTDDSRHDDVIDGSIYVAIYGGAGNTVLPRTRIEYPDSIPVSIDLEDNFRLRIEVTEGDNYEVPCLCGFTFEP
ncbi:hypothetical protein [Demequina zhanjiangensis]|uniref:NPCBM/NEW2 domain-containing protein n=1 Tax=Demequina zhanjiangensis TaxID=3051659 RepID=A0ABT8G2U4_9MICO|nr:hypothetical protein [Demequina sp. SYSU T00b26]MDN4473470.1 hypothetical protein [Demequina sp. SYSU T00b26]